MKLNQFQTELIDLIEKALKDFNDQVPAIEKEAYGRVLNLLKEIEIKNGVVINTASNLKKIGQLKQELENAVFNSKYQKAMQDFVNAFNAVAFLQSKYYKTVDQDFNPGALLKEYQKQAKDAVVNEMRKTVDLKIIPVVEDILRQNITTGGTYQNLLFKMQEFIIGSGQFPGAFGKLSNLADTITTNALNQFSAQYMKLIAQDLGLEWFMYVGSNKATTRELCERLTKKKYVHISELPTIIKGKIDGYQVKINPKTKLWYGAEEGTDVSNFQEKRGGHKCGHQFIAVHEVVVPEDVKARLAILK